MGNKGHGKNTRPHPFCTFSTHTRGETRPMVIGQTKTDEGILISMCLKIKKENKENAKKNLFQIPKFNPTKLDSKA